MSFQADRIDAGVRAAAPRGIEERVMDIQLFVVDRISPALFPRHFEPFGKAVDGNHATRAEQIGGLDGELTDGPAAPNGKDIAALDIAVLSGHIAGRKNVREKEN